VPIDPGQVRFTHSRIRPQFSGCGRMIMDTYAMVVEGKTKVDDIPNITVISSCADGYSPPYFSLNNRRLYLFKKLREDGHLSGRSPPNTVLARIKPAADSKREREKYTIEKCSETAKFMREKAKPKEGEAAAEADEGDGDVDVDGDEGEAEVAEGAERGNERKKGAEESPVIEEKRAAKGKEKGKGREDKGSIKEDLLEGERPFDDSDEEEGGRRKKGKRKDRR
jgi:hypothetical protein